MEQKKQGRQSPPSWAGGSGSAATQPAVKVKTESRSMSAGSGKGLLNFKAHHLHVHLPALSPEDNSEVIS